MRLASLSTNLRSDYATKVFNVGLLVQVRYSGTFTKHLTCSLIISSDRKKQKKMVVAGVQSCTLLNTQTLVTLYQKTNNQLEVSTLLYIAIQRIGTSVSQLKGICKTS